MRRIPQAVRWGGAIALGLSLAGVFAWFAVHAPPGVLVRLVNRAGPYTTELRAIMATFAVALLIAVVTAVIWRFGDVLQTWRLSRAIERVRRDRANADARGNV